jgi:hypothetical protein
MGRAESFKLSGSMRSFAEAAFIDKTYSRTLSRVTYASFFMPNKSPKLVLFDAGREFAGAMTKMCRNLGIPSHSLVKESHKASLNERFRHISKANDMNQRTLVPST